MSINVLNFLTVRLASSRRGSPPWRGIIEVLLMGVWGTVCYDATWDLQEGHVVCRHLGYDGAKNASDPTAVLHYTGREVVLMSSVRCNGNETTLSQCTYRRVTGGDVNACQFYELASVICTPPGNHLQILKA